MVKPNILITNDDSINAPGLRKLIDIMRPLGKVYVVASNTAMSGTSHAVTVRTPLRMHAVKKESDYEEYSCNGTPVDCVKLGSQVIIGKKPDLLVSGINHGSNAAINIVYSGTMAAVVEGCIDEIPSIGFSLMDYRYDADFDSCEPYILKICREVLDNGLPEATCLNVNIPAVTGAEIKGIRVCKQARARWVEEFDIRKDPGNKEYYWLAGSFEKLDDDQDTDQWALDNNYVSLVPVHYDFTAHHVLDEINNWKLNGEDSQ